METALESHLNNLLKNTVYGFILLEDIRDIRKENVKDTDTPFQPNCEIIEFDDADGSFYKPNDEEKDNAMFMFPAFSRKEIGLSNETGIKEICKRWNDTQHSRATFALNKWEQKNTTQEAIKRIRYFSDVIGKFDVWYYENGLASPRLADKNTEVGFKTLTGKSHEKNIDKEIERLINFHIRFYRKDENVVKIINQKMYAKAVNMKEPTLSRRFNEDKFLKRLIQRIDEILDLNFPQTQRGWTVSLEDQDGLTKLQLGIRIKLIECERKNLLAPRSKEKHRVYKFSRIES